MAIINFGLILIGLILIFRKKIKEILKRFGGPAAQAVKTKIDEQKTKLLGKNGKK
jgi:hypothetical protein